MEPAKKLYMNGTTSSGSYLVFGLKSGIGLGCKLYSIGLTNNAADQIVLFTQIRLRSAFYEPPIEDAQEQSDDETKVVSLKRAKEKAEASPVTVWGPVEWEKIRDDYASVFATRRVVIGSKLDIAGFLEGTTPAALAKAAAEYLLSFAPEQNRLMPVEQLAAEFEPKYEMVFESLKKSLAYAKAQVELDTELGGAFHLSTVALKKMQADLKAQGIGGDEVEDIEPADAEGDEGDEGGVDES